MRGGPVVNQTGRREPDRMRLSVDALGNRRWSDPNESREEKKHRHLHSCRPRNETCRTSRLWIWFMKWTMFADFGRHSFDPYVLRMVVSRFLKVRPVVRLPLPRQPSPTDDAPAH